MNEFCRLAKVAFESYHNAPYPPAEWGLTDALGYVMEFLSHHDSVDEMPGLRQAMQKMSPQDWENWRTRYPEHEATLIAPLHQEIT